MGDVFPRGIQISHFRIMRINRNVIPEQSATRELKGCGSGTPETMMVYKVKSVGICKNHTKVSSGKLKITHFADVGAASGLVV